jgi:DNA-directed RNA polymerase specialized sigma24 family protein
VSEELLEELRPWLLKKARSFSNDPATQQDLAQEGWIAAWKALQKDGVDTNPISYAKAAARWRMLSVVSGQTPTFGAKRQRFTKTEELATDVYNEFGEISSVYSRLRHTYDTLELAYHYGQIHDAIDSLSRGQKAYVVGRFWKDDSSGSRGSWNGTRSSTGAKEILREKLSHLKGVV